MPTTTEYERQLREAGLRLTRPRLVDEAEVVFWGRCPDCSTTTSQPSGGNARV